MSTIITGTSHNPYEITLIELNIYGKFNMPVINGFWDN